MYPTEEVEYNMLKSMLLKRSSHILSNNLNKLKISEFFSPTNAPFIKHIKC
jgi:hypothetical protein